MAGTVQKIWEDQFNQLDNVLLALKKWMFAIAGLTSLLIVIANGKFLGD